MVLFATSCGKGSNLSSSFKNPVSENKTLPGFAIESRKYEQSRGSYATQGSLVSPDQLELATSGLVKIFVSRNRSYGSLDLVTLLEGAASRLHDFFPGSERLQIGDTSNQNGGPAGGHASHQNGIDADLVYFRKDRREMSPGTSSSNATGFDEKFVITNRLTDNFDIVRNWKFMSILASTKRVQRIFMDPVIKATFCQYAYSQGILSISTNVLKMMRPWPLHDDHMHVRLTCPKASAHCVAQDPPPAGSGCEEAIAEVAAAETDLVSGINTLSRDGFQSLEKRFPVLREYEFKNNNLIFDFAPALQRSLESKIGEVGC